MGTIIGFVGWPCSGKDEAAGYLEGVRGAQRFGHSDFIREHAASLGIQITQTAQLSELFEERANAEGYGWIAKIVSERIVEIWTHEPDALVVISGLSNLAEVRVYVDLLALNWSNSRRISTSAINVGWNDSARANRISRWIASVRLRPCLATPTSLPSWHSTVP